MIIDRYQPLQILNMTPHQTVKFIKALNMQSRVAGLIMIRSPAEGKPFPDARYVVIETIAIYLDELNLWPEVNQLILDQLHGRDLIGDPIELTDEQAKQLELLQQQGYHPFIRSFIRGNSNLMQAINDRRIDIVERMLYVGANVNYANCYGQTALMFAVTVDRSDIVQMLLRAGADVNLTNGDGHTALDIAKKLDNPDIIKALQTASMIHGFSSISI